MFDLHGKFKGVVNVSTIEKSYKDCKDRNLGQTKVTKQLISNCTTASMYLVCYHSSFAYVICMCRKSAVRVLHV